ncbi:MAG: hypothetical protein M3Z24_08805 [Chloroflexota bacterium]|nr:hypothetical protein [Chloroflexota bacterium]
MVQLIWSIIIPVATGIVALKFLGLLSPCLKLDIECNQPTKRGIVVLRLSVKNVSRINVQTTKISLVVLSSPVNPDELSSAPACVSNEWIDFSQSNQIMASTERVSPQEEIIVERLYFVDDSVALHVGLQAEFRASAMSAILDGAWPRSKRWTTTRYFILEPTRTLGWDAQTGDLLSP